MKDTAAGLAALGRGPDTMLIHMSPREVGGLQALAKAAGGSLTTNPHTGLPEAGFLDSMLPTILGVGATVLSGGTITPLMAGMGVGGLQALRTGDLGKGLMAGLGAFGGAGLAGAAGASGLFGGAETAGAGLGGGAGLTPPGPDVSGNFAIPAPAAPPAVAPSQAPMNALFDASNESGITNAAYNPGFTGLSTPTASAPVSPPYASTDAIMSADNPAQRPTFMQALGQQFPSTGAKAAAGIGAIGALGGFEQPQLGFAAPQQQASNYRAQGANRRPYDPTAPGGYYFADRGILQPTYAAKGGEMHSVPELEDGGFVLTKKSVDGMGKGDNKRGQRAAAAGLGAIPIKGPGTGTSDSIPTTIDGKRPALLSNGEAYVPRDQVKRRGGAKKFYALMKQAEREAARRA
jgi:hypothetical protein